MTPATHVSGKFAPPAQKIVPGLSPWALSATLPETTKARVCGPFVSIGETGFEPATAEPQALGHHVTLQPTTP
jgi:hypothetical protein